MKWRSIFRDFISYEQRPYSFKLGRTVASALTGFIVGATASHIVWIAAAHHIFGAGL